MNDGKPASPFPQRNYPAKQPVVDRGTISVIVYVTICTKNRKRVLANSAAHSLIRAAWDEADTWLVGRYVVMPDHVHLFCAPRDQESPNVKKWITYWKSCATRNWRKREDKPIWQRDGWDRQLRTGDSYSEKWDYVRNNPVRHGLVSDPDDWPYQGEICEFMWHDP